MKKIIHNLRAQPEHVRRHVLHIIISIIALVLFAIWIFTLGNGLRGEEGRILIKNDLEPVANFKDNLTAGYINLQNEKR